MSNNSNNNERTGIIYAAPFFQRYVEHIFTMAKKNNVKIVSSQVGCPMGMTGIYAEFTSQEQKNQFVEGIHRMLTPVIVWAA